MASLGLTVARIEKQVIVTAPGIQGPPGIQGEVGDTGDTGPIGPQGNSISIKGTLAAGVWSAPASPTIGDIWIAGGVITGDVTAILGDGIQWTGTLWVNVGQVRGPIGLTGNSCIIRGTLSAGTWSAPGSPVAGDAWISGGVITGAVTAVQGDGIVFNGTTWNNVGQLRGPVGPSGSVNGTVGKGAVFNGTTSVANSAFYAEDANGINVTGGDLNASRGNLASSSRSWSGGRGGIVFGSTSGSRAEAALTGQALGTGDFTIIETIRVPTANPSAQQYLFALAEDASNLIYSYISTSGVIAIGIKKAGVDSFPSANLSAVSAFSGQAINYSISRTGTTLSVTCNGVLVGSVIASDLNISFTAAARYIVGNTGSSSVPYQSRIYWAPIYNRSLTTAEIADAGLYGISAADEWGSCTPVYTSDFSAGADGWSGFRSTVTGNVDGIGSPPTDNVLRIVCDSTASNTHGASKSISGLIVGKRYRLSGKAFISNSQTLVQGISIADPNNGVLYGVILQSTSWTSFSIEFVVSSSSSLAIYLRNNTSGNPFSGNGTDEAYVTDLLLTPIGCIAYPDLAAGQGGILPGLSTNNLDFTLYGSWTHIIPKWSGEWWSRLPWYLFNSISALGVNYERAFARWTTNVFQFGVEKGGSGTLRDFALMLGASTVILMKAASLVPFSNSWRVNKSSVTIAAGATYTPADTINDFHEVTINSGSGTTPIALTNLITVSTDARTVRFLITNTTGSSVTVTTTGAVTNISQAVAASGKIMFSVSIIGTTAFATVVV